MIGVKTHRQIQDRSVSSWKSTINQTVEWMDSLRSRDEMAATERGTKTSCVEPGEEVKEKESPGLVFPIFLIFLQRMFYFQDDPFTYITR